MRIFGFSLAVLETLSSDAACYCAEIIGSYILL